MKNDLSILYIEDGHKVRDSLSRSLSLAYKNSVTVAENGIDGYNLFKKNSVNYDLIITDINMPKLNGIEMIEKIRILNRNIPIFITSAYNVEQRKVSNLNVTDIMEKPINIFSLLKKINQEFRIDLNF